MTFLLLGLILWAGLHFFPGLAPDARAALIQRVGLGAYKGLFALGIVAALLLIISGWRATPPSALWNPPAFLRTLTIILMLPAMVFIIAGNVPGNAIRNRLGHPMLMGVGTWALAHLLANGELRSVLLFTALLVWSFVEIKLIKRRDGRPPAAAASGLRTILVLVIGVIAWAGLMIAHPHFTGRAVIAL